MSGSDGFRLRGLRSDAELERLFTDEQMDSTSSVKKVYGLSVRSFLIPSNSVVTYEQLTWNTNEFNCIQPPQGTFVLFRLS